MDFEHKNMHQKSHPSKHSFTQIQRRSSVYGNNLLSLTLKRIKEICPEIPTLPAKPIHLIIKTNGERILTKVHIAGGFILGKI